MAMLMTEIRTPLDARIEELSRVLAESPQDLATLRQFGESQLLRGHVIEAIGCFQRLVALTPGEAEHGLYLAGAYLEAGLLSEAAAQLQSALQAQPDNLVAHILLRRLMASHGGEVSLTVDGWEEFLPERSALEIERVRTEQRLACLDQETADLEGKGGGSGNEPLVDFSLAMARKRRARHEGALAEIAAWEKRHRDLDEQERIRREEAERARLEEEERIRREEAERARLEEEERVRREEAERARLEEEARLALEEAERVRLEEEERLRREEEEQRLREEQERLQREAEEAERARLEEAERVRLEEEERLRREAEEAERHRLEEEERLRREEEERVMREAEEAERRRLEEEERLRREAEETARLECERIEAEVRAAEEAARARVRAREEAYERLRAGLDPVVGVLMKTKGVTSVLVVARDGMPVHRSLRDEISLDKVSEFVASGVNVLNVPDASGQLATWQFWVLEFARGILVLQKVTSDYYLVVVGQAGANFGVLTWTIDKNRAQLEDALKGAPPVPTDEPRP